MPLRQLLNVSYSALSQGRDDDGMKELDELLEHDPSKPARRRPTGNFSALVAATKMEQKTE